MQDCKLHWTLENKFDLVFVVVYGKLLTLLYIDELLERVKEAFISHFEAALPTYK